MVKLVESAGLKPWIVLRLMSMKNTVLVLASHTGDSPRSQWQSYTRSTVAFIFAIYVADEQENCNL